MSPDEAIEGAAAAGAETRYRNQLAREAYQAGHADGYRAGYRQAGADQAVWWNQAARASVSGPSPHRTRRTALGVRRTWPLRRPAPR